MSSNVVSATGESAPFNPLYFSTIFLTAHAPKTWPRVFAIVTGHNPEGRTASHQENTAFNALLDAKLREAGILECETFAIDGASPDRAHCEESRGFATSDLALVARLADELRQEAFFWVQENTIFICTDASGRGWYVGTWTERFQLEKPKDTEKTPREMIK